MDELIRALASRDIPATPQRLAVAQFVLHTADHPTADHATADYPTADWGQANAGKLWRGRGVGL
jgi:Fe2+ or Zn2+ uptake regulation protein